MTGHRSSFVAAIGWATASVLLGHELVYRLYAPDDVTRARLLDETGHVWAGLAETTMVVAALTGIAGSLVGSRRWGLTHIRFGVLAMVQCAMFLAIELGERAGMAGGPVGVDTLPMVVVLGLAIQLVLAAVGSVLSRCVAHLGLAVQGADVVRRRARTRLGAIRWLPVDRRSPHARPRAPPALAPVWPSTTRPRRIGPGSTRKEGTMSSRPIAAAAAIASLLVLTTAIPTLGHASIPDGSEVAGGGHGSTIHIRIGHGCGEAPTDTIEVAVPDGVYGVLPESIAGWTTEMDVEQVEPYEFQGGEFTERVTVVRWTGGSLPSELYQDFGIVAVFPEDPQVITIPVVQRCGTDEQAWIEVPAEGQDPETLDFPAPTVTIVASGDGHAD